jgi:hypothetical protein
VRGDERRDHGVRAGVPTAQYQSWTIF